MTTTVDTSATSPAPPPATDSTADPNRWKALGVIAIAQLMVVLDASIVNIALPHAQRSLHISNADRQWVVTAYTLAFGGLLLLGGRIADYVGRKRVFIIGLLAFAAASGLGGAAPTAGLLFAARALQGAAGALLAPAALSLVTVTFTEPRERAKAFGVYGGISGGGAAIGLIVGGLLTEVNWRLCLYVNIPIAILAAAAAVPLVRESRAPGNTRYDVPGAASITAGLVALVYGFTKASTDGWSSSVTLSSLAVAVVLLVAFVIIELRATNPLLPLRVPAERNRGGSYLAILLVGGGLFAMFLFLTYYFQGVLGYSALRTGFAFLPFSGGIIVAAVLSSKLLPRLGPRPLAVFGLLLGVLGLALLTSLPVRSSYVPHVLIPELLLSVGMGFTFVTLQSTALVGVGKHDAGVASALVNTAQQVGGSLGTALLNTLAATATASYLHHHVAALRGPLGRSTLAHAQVHGFTAAFAVGAGLLVVAAVAVAVLVNARRDELGSDAGLAVG